MQRKGFSHNYPFCLRHQGVIMYESLFSQVPHFFNNVEYFVPRNLLGSGDIRQMRHGHSPQRVPMVRTTVNRPETPSSGAGQSLVISAPAPVRSSVTSPGNQRPGEDDLGGWKKDLHSDYRWEKCLCRGCDPRIGSCKVKSLDGWIGSDLLCRRKTQNQRWSQGTGTDAGHAAGAAACLDKGFDSSWLVFGVGETDVTSAVHGRECGMAPSPGPFGGNLQNGPTQGSSSQRLTASCSHSAYHPFHLQRPAWSHSAITCWMCRTSTFLSSAALQLFEQWIGSPL